MSDIYITWEEYNKKIEELAVKVYEDGCKFNQVICIAKGGLRVGDVFSRLFDVPLAIMSVESYKKGTGNILDQQGQFTFSRDLAKTTPNLGSHVLLVDDLADSGKTLIKSIKFAEQNLSSLDIKLIILDDNSNDQNLEKIKTINVARIEIAKNL